MSFEHTSNRQAMKEVRREARQGIRTVWYLWCCARCGCGCGREGEAASGGESPRRDTTFMCSQLPTWRATTVTHYHHHLRRRITKISTHSFVEVPFTMSHLVPVTKSHLVSVAKSRLVPFTMQTESQSVTLFLFHLLLSIDYKVFVYLNQ